MNYFYLYINIHEIIHKTKNEIWHEIVHKYWYVIKQKNQSTNLDITKKKQKNWLILTIT